MTSLLDRWEAKVDRTADCWLWTGGLTKEGYGRIRAEGGERMAHRVGYELLVGPIPDGLELDHLCRVHRCVNPAHLDPVVHAVNVERGRVAESNRLRGAAITMCKVGHPFDEANTLRLADGRRQCRACNAERQRRSRAARMAA